MKKIILFIALFATYITAHTQTKFLTKTGTIQFEASVPSFEEVKAKNNGVTAILNTNNGEFAALALVKGFRFKNALMEEHFNENYAESEIYPKATFKGKITKFSMAKIKTPHTLTISGELTFHGKTKQLKDIAVLVSKKGDNILLSGTFKVTASDFNIDIPKIVRNKVSETVKVDFNFNLSAK
ncbi:YceI family protein [Mangrovimonas spongiae]|uniref:YceI family protein n=1 Tax=Mangrovimonas spongiae TaxID=2494697 RepID=A0A3R9UTE8_9FLAO|nr:YceI family protein [Mangrovimonas spongiae]RSK39700.1 YceI family protein [Mangrovimonas spongiae]